ncbi:MAG: hypothetical protein IKU87_00825 [Clostridia bacterium]|nr:hypothetical protein [Clostridia bacterium]
MKCTNCGKRIKKNAVCCKHCGKNFSEEKTSSELIDAMPELHDELHKISKMRENAQNKHPKKPYIICAILVLACLLGVWFGINYYNEKEKQTNAEVILVSSGVSGSAQNIFYEDGISAAELKDSESAQNALNDRLPALFVADENTKYSLKDEYTVKNNTYYRFKQTFCGVDVCGGELVLASLNNGSKTLITGTLIETDGLSIKHQIGSGSASNAISSYISKLPSEFVIATGTNVTEPKKVVCNFENVTYLAYTANVSGYNENGEYTAYDVFIDAGNGNGITISHTSSFENSGEESNISSQILTDDEVVYDSPVSYHMVNDKFNWNDETKTSAVERINVEDFSGGFVSPYVVSTKKAVENAYSYFENKFGCKGLDGKSGHVRVYLNANEYLDEKLPPYRAMYTRDILMFIREDLTSGELSLNTAVHEFAHGIMKNVANLCGTQSLTQNSVISESLADVFGELSELSLTGASDWIHGGTNLSTPGAGYYVAFPETINIENTTSVYALSTVIGHSYYKMYESGISADILGDLAFNTVMLMTSSTDFKDFLTITQYLANSMSEEGRITPEQLSMVSVILSETGINPSPVVSSMLIETP